jgi:4-hydroxybenzoate polyprenyltransferase
MLAFIRLTRPVNLLIIALTMVAMRYGVIGGNLERALGQLIRTEAPGTDRAALSVTEGYGPQLPLVYFILLVLGTMLIAAGGNVINDYFDTRIDRINKPGAVIVGRSVKRRVAMTGHVVMSALGFLLCAIAAWRTGLLQWALIPAFCIGGLWTYSTSWKRKLVLGNGLVALLTALVPLSAGLYEIPLLKRSFLAQAPVITLPGGERFSMEVTYGHMWYWILAFAGLAFLGTLVRELQKDMADVKGDLAGGCRTVPIVWGMKWARALALVHIGLIIVGLLFLRSAVLRDTTSFLYIGFGIIGPLLLSAGFTYNAASRSEHLRAGTLMKVAMVVAVGYAFLIRFLP